MDEEPKPNKAPAMFKHCITVYEAMEAQAVERDIYGAPRPVWEGFLTKLFHDLGFAVPMYTSVRQELMRMGCIRQFRRGGGQTPSVWILYGRPTVAKYNVPVAESIDTKSGAPRKRSMKILEAQIKDLHQRVEVLEKAIIERVG